MSALLKAGDPAAGAAVRTLDAAMKPAVPALSHPEDAAPALSAFPAEPAVPDPVLELGRQCRALEAEIAGLRQKLAEAEETAQAREKAAFEEGQQAGLTLTTGEADKRLEQLASGLERLHQSHADRLTEHELLALQLARTALGRVFGDEQIGAELVAATIAAQLERIGRDMVLAVRVSPRDFGSEDELAQLAQALPGLAIERDGALAAGECLADLRLGRVDLGLPGQWQRLSAFFDLLAQEEVGR